MTEIELAEFNSREAARFSLANLDAARTRAHQLLLVLLGGGAGMGSLGLQQWGQSPLLAGASIGAALLWFALAWQVCRSALSSAEVRAWAQAGLIEQYEQWQRYDESLRKDQRPGIDPLAELRKASLRSTDSAAEGYRSASSAAYDALDNAFKSMATTPVAALLGLGVVAGFRAIAA